MEKTAKISVLMPSDEASQFDDYCRREGYKKSTLILRLIREHLDQKKNGQGELFLPEKTWGSK